MLPPTRRLACALALIVFLPACRMTVTTNSSVGPTTTLAIVNARVWTGASRRPWADAVAVAGDRISIVGSSAEVMKTVSEATRVVDAKGQMLVPGFIDAHVHFMSDRKSTRLNSSHLVISYAVFCLKKTIRPGRRERLQRAGRIL